MYALVKDGVLVAVRNPGRVEYKLLDGAPLSPPSGGWTERLANACGFYVVVDPGPPSASATQIVEWTVQLISGTPTRVYVLRDKTQAELAADVAEAAARAEREQAKQALTALQTFIDRGPNNTAAQVRDMTVIQARILRRLIRDAFGDVTA